MLYNKNNVRKTNDKKILHKVGKQWKVISVALLMAIGGGAAVATHANAQSNNGVNASTSAEVAALDTKPAVQSAQSVAPSSASASASASAKPVSKVSYLSGDNGSAASYRDNALNDRYVAQSNGAIVNGYVKSLNAKFGNVTALLNGRTASASANAKSDASLSNSYSAVAANSDNKSGMNSLAAKSGLTPNDYASNVAWNVENIYNPAVKSASANQSALNLVSGLAEKFMGVNFDELNAETSANNAVANANVAVENAKSSAANEGSASAAVTSNDSALASATIASIEASGENAGRALTLSGDNSAVNSFAKSNSLDVTSVSSEVQTYAKSAVSSVDYTSFFSGNSNDVAGRIHVSANYNFSNANSAAVNTNALNNVVSNAAYKYAAASVAAKANSAMASAIAAKPSLAANLASAKSASNVNSAASASANAASLVAEDVQAAVSVVANSLGSNANYDKKASVAVNLLKDPSLVKGHFNNLSKSNAYEDTDIASLASAYGVDLDALKNAEPALKNLANNVPNGLNNASAVSSYASSVANSVATDYTKATQSSASYSNATDENVTLASYFASSYSVNASSNASLASDYANSTNAFYNSNISNPKFTAADAAYNAAKAAEPNDNALAVAFGNHVFNYAPKYLTVLKPVALYHVANSKFTRVVNVPVGTRLTVTGVQFMQNGAVRYQTSYKGKQGTVNSYKSYVKQTYLTPQNDVDVTVVKPSKVYASVSKNGFGKVAAKTLPAGAKLSDVNIVSADNVYGGFTAVETKSGKFVSANIAYAKVNNANANNNQTNNGSTNSNHVSFWA